LSPGLSMYGRSWPAGSPGGIDEALRGGHAKRDKVRRLGNAFTLPVAEPIVSALVEAITGGRWRPKAGDHQAPPRAPGRTRTDTIGPFRGPASAVGLQGRATMTSEFRSCQ
jgi:hypothetical protein